MKDWEVIKTGDGESDWRVQHRDDLFWFLDKWLIPRKDGDTVLNGTAEEFEKQLRALIQE